MCVHDLYVQCVCFSLVSCKCHELYNLYLTNYTFYIQCNVCVSASCPIKCHELYNSYLTNSTICISWNYTFHIPRILWFKHHKLTISGKTYIWVCTSCAYISFGFNMCVSFVCVYAMCVYHVCVWCVCITCVYNPRVSWCFTRCVCVCVCVCVWHVCNVCVYHVCVGCVCVCFVCMTCACTICVHHVRACDMCVCHVCVCVKCV